MQHAEDFDWVLDQLEPETLAKIHGELRLVRDEGTNEGLIEGEVADLSPGDIQCLDEVIEDVELAIERTKGE